MNDRGYAPTRTLSLVDRIYYREIIYLSYSRTHAYKRITRLRDRDRRTPRDIDNGSSTPGWSRSSPSL
jgi:hypothetical protein